MNIDFTQIVPWIPYLLGGIGATLKLVVVSILLGLLLGTLLALCKLTNQPILKGFANVYTSIFRGTPLILQLVIIYFGIPQITGYDIGAYESAVLAFGLNSGAYVSEIIRAGILAVDKGQVEAAQALGIPYKQMMKDIILPQAMKNILPSLMNEFITLNKESAVVTVIGGLDIMRRAYIVGGATFKYLEPLLFAGLIYYIMTLVLSFIGRRLEMRMRRSD